MKQYGRAWSHDKKKKPAEKPHTTAAPQHGGLEKARVETRASEVVHHWRRDE